MTSTVHALLISRDDASRFWIGEFAKGERSEGGLSLPGGKVNGGEQIFTALVRELCEETSLPAPAFEVALLRPVQGQRYKGEAYCFVVWLNDGYVPSDSQEMVSWRAATVREALREPDFAEFCMGFLLSWLERDDCPLSA